VVKKASWYKKLLLILLELHVANTIKASMGPPRTNEHEMLAELTQLLPLELDVAL
jgi:hypothetical protein